MGNDQRPIISPIISKRETTSDCVFNENTQPAYDVALTKKKKTFRFESDQNSSFNKSEKIQGTEKQVK